jgi:hypothetical protein
MYPSVLEHYSSFLQLIEGKRLAVFLDYDGVWRAPRPPARRGSPIASARTLTGRPPLQARWRPS